LPINKLILGDNLEILKTIESESVDLVYLDPPFFSNRNYEVIWGDTGEHSIAVKVVDNDGLENTEVVRLKVNGVVEKV
jgi:DNA modification methylase